MICCLLCFPVSCWFWFWMIWIWMRQRIIYVLGNLKYTQDIGISLYSIHNADILTLFYKAIKAVCHGCSLADWIKIVLPMQLESVEQGLLMFHQGLNQLPEKRTQGKFMTLFGQPNWFKTVRRSRTDTSNI